MTEIYDEVELVLDKENAEAAKEIAVLGKELVKAGGGFGKYLAEVLGQLPHNMVGIISDKFKEYRYLRQLRSAVKIMNNVEQLHCSRNTDADPDIIPLKLIEPLIDAATSESRDVLLGIWSRLIANATDPQRTDRVRKEYIQILNEFEPEDAIVLETISKLPKIDTPKDNNGKGDSYDWRDGTDLSKLSGMHEDKVIVALVNLERLNCILTGESKNARDEMVPMQPSTGAVRIEQTTLSTTRRDKWTHKPMDVCYMSLGRELLRALEE